MSKDEATVVTFAGKRADFGWEDRGWRFTKEELDHPPSIDDNMSLDEERTLRRKTHTFVVDSCKMLKLPTLVIASSMMICQRYFALVSFRKIDRTDVAAAAIYLSSKVEENRTSLKNVLQATYAVRHTKEGAPPAHLDSRSKDFQTYERRVLKAENQLINAVGFDFLIEHPYSHLPHLCQLIQRAGWVDQSGMQRLLSSALVLLNLSLKGTMCLQYPPTFRARLMIFCSLLFHGVRAKNHSWVDFLQFKDVRVLNSACCELVDCLDQDAGKHGNKPTKGLVVAALIKAGHIKSNRPHLPPPPPKRRRTYDEVLAESSAAMDDGDDFIGAIPGDSDDEDGGKGSMNGQTEAAPTSQSTGRSYSEGKQSSATFRDQSPRQTSSTRSSQSTSTHGMTSAYSTSGGKRPRPDDNRYSKPKPRPPPPRPPSSQGATSMLSRPPSASRPPSKPRPPSTPKPPSVPKPASVSSIGDTQSAQHTSQNRGPRPPSTPHPSTVKTKSDPRPPSKPHPSAGQTTSAGFSNGKYPRPRPPSVPRPNSQAGRSEHSDADKARCRPRPPSEPRQLPSGTKNCNNLHTSVAAAESNGAGKRVRGVDDASHSAQDANKSDASKRFKANEEKALVSQCSPQRKAHGFAPDLIPEDGEVEDGEISMGPAGSMVGSIEAS